MDGYEEKDEQLSTEDILERIMEMRDQAWFLLREVVDQCRDSYLMAILEDLKENPLH
jgi:hypothetical protein